MPTLPGRPSRLGGADQAFEFRKHQRLRFLEPRALGLGNADAGQQPELGPRDAALGKGAVDEREFGQRPADGDEVAGGAPLHVEAFDGEVGGAGEAQCPVPEIHEHEFLGQNTMS